MSRRSSEKPTGLFRRGVEALAELGFPVPAIYVCPLCLRGFGEEELGSLTKEHVPPRSLGGTVLVLTCCSCNQGAAGQNGADTHARRAEDSLDLIVRSPGFKRRVRFGSNGRTMNAQLSVTPAGFEVIGMPGPPREAEAVMSALDRIAPIDAADRTISLAVQNGGFTQRLMEISWLKSGFLAAFAAFGYSYAVRKVMKSVRRQITNPNEQLIDYFHFGIPSPDPKLRAIVLTSEPEWIQGIAIIMGRHGVLLPLHDEDLDFYTRLRRLGESPSRLQIQGLKVSWPTSPRFELDFQPQGSLSELIACVRKGSKSAGQASP